LRRGFLLESFLLSPQFHSLGKRIVAIVDPPREGLHPKVIQALRQCKELNTLIYISCNHG
jgi:tRNA (uracil-5-)-methyltransferase